MSSAGWKDRLVTMNLYTSKTFVFFIKQVFDITIQFILLKKIKFAESLCNDVAYYKGYVLKSD